MSTLGDIIAGVGSVASSIFKDPSAMGQFMGNYRFPSDLTSGPGRNFYIDIQFQKYQRRSIFQQPFLQASGGIQLPIPNGLAESMRVDWGEEKGGMVGAGIENALGFYNNNISENVSLSNVREAINNTAVAAAFKGGTTLATNLGLPVAQGLQLVGKAENPFYTMLFKRPNFREYTFSWKLAPRNAQESDTVKQIISAFKANMLPAMAPGSGGVFLTYPNMAAITFYPAQEFLYKFKPCVVADLKVNYADGGMPSFFKGTNAPTLVNITVTLKEIEYWLREDIVNPGLRSEGMIPVSPSPQTQQQTPPSGPYSNGRENGTP